MARLRAVQYSQWGVIVKAVRNHIAMVALDTPLRERDRYISDKQGVDWYVVGPHGSCTCEGENGGSDTGMTQRAKGGFLAKLSATSDHKMLSARRCLLQIFAPAGESWGGEGRVVGARGPQCTLAAAVPSVQRALLPPLPSPPVGGRTTGDNTGGLTAHCIPAYTAKIRRNQKGRNRYTILGPKPRRMQTGKNSADLMECRFSEG